MKNPEHEFCYISIYKPKIFGTNKEQEEEEEEEITDASENPTVSLNE